MRIDFHAHVLPRADHGSDSLETSLEQLKSAITSGVDIVVASAHFYPKHDRLDPFLARRAASVAELTSVNQPGKIRVLPGAEVAVYEGMEQMEGLEKLCIGGSNVILLEMPLTAWSEQLLETVYEIEHVRGLRPVMAHIDRYPTEDVERLLAVGAAAQLNAEALCSLRTRWRCLGYVKRGAVWALGSDIHGNSGAYRNYEKAIRLLGKDADFIMRRSAELLKECLDDRKI